MATDTSAELIHHADPAGRLSFDTRDAIDDEEFAAFNEVLRTAREES